MARTGKIARLPFAIREELNRRLQNGEPASRILPWLNALPEVLQVLGEDFEGLSVNDQNLSDWRKGGYQDWLKQNDRRHIRLERTKELAQMSMQLAQAGGGSLTEGAAAIVSGHILEVLEQIDDLQNVLQDDGPNEEGKSRLQVASEAIAEITNAIARLRRGDHDKEILRQNEKRLAQKDEDLKLAREQFEQRLKEYQDKVLEQKRTIEGALTQAKAGGITPETLRTIEEAAKLL